MEPDLIFVFLIVAWLAGLFGAFAFFVEEKFGRSVCVGGCIFAVLSALWIIADKIA